MMQPIPEFNGMLFKDADVPEHIDAQQIHVLERLDSLNWADVEPSIFGTLFERILNPDTRTKLGAHYTSRDDIELIVQPVLMEPLTAKWNAIKAEIAAAMEKASPKSGVRETVRQRLRGRLLAFARELSATSSTGRPTGRGCRTACRCASRWSDSTTAASTTDYLMKRRRATRRTRSSGRGRSRRSTRT
jgi:hypothetical protein